MKSLEHWAFLLSVWIFLFSSTLFAKVTIYLCGDSTMQDWNEGYYPKRGIGQEFGYFWNSDAVSVENRGAGGTYAMGYYKSNWPGVLSSLKSGDFVIIQFGINDRAKSSEADFVTATTAMAKEALAKGATPIIVNPVRRSDFRFSSSALAVADSIYESYHGYPIRAREIAASLNVPLIDMDTLSRNYLLSVGQYYALHYVNMYLDAGEYSNYGSGNSDNLHLQQNGAIAFGRILSEQMRIHSDEKVRNLAKNLAPMYSLNVKVSPEGSDSATTVSSYYPAGIPVTLKTTPRAGKKFLGWYDGNGKKVGNLQATVNSETICTFSMTSASTQYTAVYEGGKAELYTGNGAALSMFPTGTPKVLADVDPTGGVEIDTTVVYEKNIKKWIDASLPDSFDAGWTESSNAGYSGGGYWNFANALSTFADYRMVFPSAGRATLGIVYANGGTASRMLNVYLDHDYPVNFPPTGSWTAWDTAWVNVDLPLGEETMRLISLTEDGGPNIDAFGFSVPGVERAASEKDLPNGETEGNDSTTAVSGAFPNGGFSLAGNRLRLETSGMVVAELFDMSGRLLAFERSFVAQGSTELFAETRLSPGIYRIRVTSRNGSASATWARVR